MPEISIVIPTRNHAAWLGRCLQGLCEQTLEPPRFEICVVNNGSTDMTAKVIDLVKAHYTQHRLFLVDEPRLGVAQARNTGIDHTTAPLIAQTDDDIAPPPDWLEKILASFAAQGNDVGKIGGAVDPVWNAPRPAWLTDALLPLLMATRGLGDSPGYVDHALPLCNGIYRREALAAAGPFPVTLGRKGNNLLANENVVDRVLNANGWRLFYDPSLVVQHNILPERLMPLWFRRGAFWQGVSDYAAKVYLKTKGIESSEMSDIDMPFDRDNWTFINDANEPPTEDKLNRLRSLGFTLAKSGFIPIS